MRVILLSHTPEPERLVAAAARLCYSSDNALAIYQEMYNKDKRDKQINLLRKIGHDSPLEHVSFTFELQDVSRALLAQITRHRIASFSVRSQRYVSMDKDVVIPPEISNNEAAWEIYREAVDNAFKSYNELSEILEKSYLENGMDKRAAEKKAIEDARFVLPNATCTSIVMTMNARELLHFFSLRTCNRAQWEIREVADKMLAQCYEVAPTIFANAGCGCCDKGCTEGVMSCGHSRKEEIEKIKKGVKNDG